MLQTMLADHRWTQVHTSGHICVHAYGPMYIPGLVLILLGSQPGARWLTQAHTGIESAGLPAQHVSHDAQHVKCVLPKSDLEAPLWRLCCNCDSYTLMCI